VLYFYNNTCQSVNISGPSYVDIINSKKDVAQQITSVYGSYKNFSYTVKKEEVLDTVNRNQNSLNSVYNETHTNISGTCAEVASLIMLKYFADIDNKNFTDYNQEYANIIRLAINNNYLATNGTGTNVNVIASMFSKILNSKSISRKVSQDSWNLYDVIKNNVNISKPTLLTIENHAVVSCGYIEYEVKFTKTVPYWIFWTRDVATTETMRFAVINDGWSNSTVENVNDKNYSYIWAEKMNYNFWDWLHAVVGTSAYNNIIVGDK